MAGILPVLVTVKHAHVRLRTPLAVYFRSAHALPLASYPILVPVEPVNPDAAERRSHKRYRFPLGVAIEAWVGENMTSPRRLMGHTIDVSYGGMRLIFENIPRDLYEYLTAEPRQVQIDFEDPFAEKHIRLQGMAMEISLYNSGPDSEIETCDLRICLDTDSPPDVDAYIDLVDRLETGVA